jgi:hypothetical protein
MRNRAFRIYKEDLKVIKRIKSIEKGKYYYGYLDINNISHSNAILSDYIGSCINFKYKSLSTKPSSSKFKSKYSSNRNTHCWWTRTINTRVGRKVETSLLIKEHYASLNS